MGFFSFYLKVGGLMVCWPAHNALAAYKCNTKGREKGIETNIYSTIRHDQTESS